MVLSIATLLVLGVIADDKPAKEEKKAIEPAAAEPAAEASKKQDKRGLEYDFGGYDFGGDDHGHHHFDHHEEKTLTIVKKIPVPYKVEKTVHVPVEKISHYPVHVHVPKPYPVEKVSQKNNNISQLVGSEFKIQIFVKLL